MAGDRPKSQRTRRTGPDPFATVRTAGLALPGVEAATRYDGSPVLKVGGAFMAGLAMHESAEPGTLVVRAEVEERTWLLEEEPAIYYLTDYYERYALVLVRLAAIHRDALRDVLSMSRRLTLMKAAPRLRRRDPGKARRV